MSSSRRIRDTGLLVVMLAAALALALTHESETLESLSARALLPNSALRVDDTPLQTARFAARLASTLEEREFAQEAVRLADQDLDLAYTEAIRTAAEYPPALTPEVREVAARVNGNSARVKADQDNINKLTEQLKLARPARLDELQTQLELTQATLQLDQDELDDAEQDLTRAGGDPASALHRAYEQHKLSEQHATDVALAEAGKNTAAANYAAGNLVAQLTALYALADGKASLLRQAREETLATATALKHSRDALEQIASQAQAPQGATRESEQSGTPVQELTLLRRQSNDQRTLKALGQRIDNQQRLSNIYGGWIGLVSGHQNRAQRGVMRSVLWILLTVLATHFGDRLLQRVLSGLSQHRGGLGNFPAVAHFAMQVSGVLLILAVIFGIPEQLPAAVFGVVGAGVTVASKDLALGFIDSRVKSLTGAGAKLSEESPHAPTR